MIENMGFETIKDGRDLSVDGTGRLNYSGAADEVFVSPGLAWLDEVAGTNTPFFVAFHTNASHHPYTLPESYDAMQLFDSDETYNRYLNTLRYTDSILERLFDEFEARQWIDDTIFVIVGDHGELFGSHGATFPHCHFLWEDAVRVPLIVHAPRYIRRQYVHPGPLQLVDVFPTVLDILRMNVSGEAVLGISAADGLAREPVMLSASANQAMALMSDSLKYHYYFGRQEMKVFNILSDPAEEIDLSGEISAEEKNAIVARLLNWRRAVNASYGL